MPASIPSEELPGKARVRWEMQGGGLTQHTQGGHCCLAMPHLLLPSSSQHGLQQASHPRGLPSSQTSHTPQASTYHRNSCGKPCWPLGLTQGIPQARPATPGDTLPCPSQPSTNAQQKPAAHSPHRCPCGFGWPPAKKRPSLSSALQQHLVPAFPRV